MLGLIERRESRTRQKHLQVSPLVTFPFLNPLRGIHDYLKEKKKRKCNVGPFSAKQETTCARGSHVQ